MAERRSICIGKLRLENATTTASASKTIMGGNAATQAAVYAEVPSDLAIGSVYLGAGVMYHKVANNGAAADWYKATSTNA